MASQPSLISSERPRAVAAARQKIESLVQARLAGKCIDAVTFVEELLAIATQVGEVTCSPVDDRGLRFELAGSEPLEVNLEGNRGKLRMLCARLAVLCHESGDELMLYGGDGTVRRMAKGELGNRGGEPIVYSLAWKAHWSNTPGKHEFTISVAR
jgi:hypothetical protein